MKRNLNTIFPGLYLGNAGKCTVHNIEIDKKIRSMEIILDDDFEEITFELKNSVSELCKLIYL